MVYIEFNVKIQFILFHLLVNLVTVLAKNLKEKRQWRQFQLWKKNPRELF